ncbi:MAG: hypothetical protein JNL83_29975 [Myxococcales bacterium]|nr:hypothetical protein [Myxococcales bacterium]
MPVVNFDESDEVVAGEEAKAPPKSESPASRAGQTAMAMLQRGNSDPEAYAAILREQPGLRENLIRQLHQRFGNKFVTAVLAAVDRDSSATAVADDPSPEGGGTGRERNPDVEARRKANQEARSTQKVAKSDGGVVDGMVDSLDLIPVGPVAEAVDRGTHREGLIQGIGGIQQTIFQNINRSIEAAMRLIEPAEAPKDADRGWLGQLLAFAASTSIYGMSAAIGAWAGAALFGGGGKNAPATSDPGKNSVGKQKFVENIVKQTVRSAFSVEGSDWKLGNVQDLKDAYWRALTKSADGASAKFAKQWSSLHDRLAQLSDSDLEEAHQAAQTLIGADVDAIQTPLIDRAVVGWTNFLAQMTNGKMGPWDMAERNGSKGALATKDAQPAPSEPKQDPTGANVDPAVLDKKLELGQPGGHAKPESGMLEIFVDGSGQLIDSHGMRLADVGPKVRERIAEMGRVGDLRVNKIIHVVGDPRQRPISVDGVIVVTADGYIRDVNWPSNQQVAIDFENPVGPARIPEGIGAMRDLTAGKPSKARRVESKENANVSRIVELVQNLSLHQLKP